MKSGEVIWIEFPGVVQTKRRPAVILSSATSFRSFIVTLPATAVVSTMGALTSRDWTEVLARIKLAIELN
jgi:mRNA-degrading endonuclease toxin of MazEF toxin-antitoxin module